MQETDYSIIIPAYNEEELLPSCLDNIMRAVRAIKKYKGEVILVDNASTDRTAEIGREMGARVIFESHRQIARARNRGAQEAKGRFLIFVDADTYPPPKVIFKALCLLASGKVVAGGAAIDSTPGGKSWYRFTVWFGSKAMKVYKFAAGSFIYTLREAFKAVGGFPELFYATEEVHFSRKLVAWGKKRGLRFHIINRQVLTSPRKADWFSLPMVVTFILKSGLMPWTLTKREACWPWYQRPDQDT